MYYNDWDEDDYEESYDGLAEAGGEAYFAFNDED